MAGAPPPGGGLFREPPPVPAAAAIEPYASGPPVGTGGARRLRFRLFLGFCLLVVLLSLVLTRYLWWPGVSAVERAPIVTAKDPQVIIEPPPETERVQVPPPEPAPPPPAEPPLARQLRTERAQRGRAQEVAMAFKVQDAPQRGWYQDGRRPMLAPGCALRPGATAIPAVLTSVLKSDIRGQVSATVSEDVFSEDAGHTADPPLIPQGTELVGIYDNADLDFTSRRIGIVWTEAVLPGGRQIALGDADGQDVAGSMGVGGHVTTQWGPILAATAIYTLLDVGVRATDDDSDSYQQDAQDSFNNNAGRVGRTVVDRALDWKPKIVVPAGTRVRVAVNKTLRVC